MRKEDFNGRRETKCTSSEGTSVMRSLLERMKETMTMESLDEETARMMERLVVVRISTKHINLWMRQLEMKRKEMMELAGLMGLERVQEEIERTKDLEMWAKRCTTHFTKNVKRKLFEAIDNMAWSGDEERDSHNGARRIRSLMKSPRRKLKIYGTGKAQTKNPSD